MSFIRGMSKRRKEVAGSCSSYWEKRLSDEERKDPSQVFGLSSYAFREGVRYILRKLGDVAVKGKR